MSAVIQGLYRVYVRAVYQKRDDQIDLLSNLLDKAGFEVARNADLWTL